LRGVHYRLLWIFYGNDLDWIVSPGADKALLACFTGVQQAEFISPCKSSLFSVENIPARAKDCQVKSNPLNPHGLLFSMIPDEEVDIALSDHLGGGESNGQA
jgi:hypothetical protein